LNAPATRLLSCLFSRFAVGRFSLAFLSLKTLTPSLCCGLLFLMPIASAREIRWNSLNLNPQQQSSIQQLENHWQQTHGEVMTQIERDRQELRNQLSTGDTQRIRALQNRMISNKMFLMNESMNTFLQKRDLLSPEQRLQLQKMLPDSLHNLHTIGGGH
jgi:Spy/CpxP family protein refolding chaperone